MNKWEHIRRQAREFHSESSQIPSSAAQDSPETSEIASAKLIENAAQMLGIKIKGYPAKHPFLRGTVARTEGDKILFNRDVDEWLALYNQAHELGHVVLDHGARECTAEDINCEAT